MKTEKNAYLIPPHRVMVNKETYYREYEGHTKCSSLITVNRAKKNFFLANVFGMTLLHAHDHYICIVCAKYQRASVKALVQADFLCMHYLSTSITPI